MTPEQEQQFNKLIEYVKELAQQHNVLEQKVAELDHVPAKIEIEEE